MDRHICKVCDLTNVEPNIIVDGRQRFKCLDCLVLFFDDGVSFKVEKIESVLEVPAQKIYSCRKCDFTTPDKYKLIGHYSSVHSWWHKEKEEPPVKTELLERQPENKLVHKQWEGRLGELSMLAITEYDLAQLDDEQFKQMWFLLGCILRNRLVGNDEEGTIG